MIVGIMQPYFFPYIGYWQLINFVDTFVIYDDVNYINKGWIDRNNILIDGSSHSIKLALKKKSQNKKINELELFCEGETLLGHLKVIRNIYQKAPYFKQVYPLLEMIFSNEIRSLSLFLENSLVKVSEYIGITTSFTMSSDLQINDNLKGEEKILWICKELGANIYVNAIGGRKLYSHQSFFENGIELYFLEARKTKYCQYGDDFVSDLSIIDVMMFNSVEEIRKMLINFDLKY